MPLREWAVPVDDDGTQAMLISQSTVGSLELSPCRVISIPSGVKPLTTKAMFSGTVPHAVIEAFLKGEIDRLKAVSVKYIVGLAAELLNDEQWPDDLEDLVGDVLTWAGGIAELISAWLTGPYALEIRHMDVIEIEVPRFKFHPYGRLPYTDRRLAIVTGGIDFIGRDPERGIVGIDWKTTGRQWYQNAGAGRIQHQLYDFLVEDELEVDEWVYWVGDNSKNDWQERKAKVTEATKAAALERTWQWAVYLDDPDRPYLCTPSEGKARGWWAKPDYNHGWCPLCRHLGDGFDRDWVNQPARGVDEAGNLVERFPQLQDVSPREYGRKVPQ